MLGTESGHYRSLLPSVVAPRSFRCSSIMPFGIFNTAKDKQNMGQIKARAYIIP